MFRTESDYLEWLAEQEDISVFVNPSYWQAIIGTNYDNGGLVYDYDRMIDVLSIEDGMTSDEAIEWIDYNVLRTIPYMQGSRPVIVWQREI